MSQSVRSRNLLFSKTGAIAGATAVVILLAVLFAADRLQATPSCGTWDVKANADWAPGAEAQAITINWANGPVSCTSGGTSWGGTSYYAIVRETGLTTGAASTTAGTLVDTIASTSTTYTDYVYRSEKQYTYTIFACTDATCATVYGTYTNEYDDHRTGREKFVLKGISDESDTDSGVFPPTSSSGENAPDAFFYPSSWVSWADQLALYYSTSGKYSTSTSSKIYYMRYGSTGWPGGTGVFNDDPDNSYTANWGLASLVAEGSILPADDDYLADHPWTMLTDDGAGNQHVELFAQSQHTGGGNRIVQIQSTDEKGTNFGLGCGSGSPCTYTLNHLSNTAIHGGVTTGATYVDAARHSRVHWNYLTDGVIDPASDTVHMMFQVGVDTAGSSPCTTAATIDSIGHASASYSSSSWNWTVDTSSSCPIEYFTDVHDNTMIPLPNGEWKMYFKEYAGSQEWKVVYFDGGAWVDEAHVAFWFDNGASSTQVSDSCIENMAGIAYDDSVSIRQGAFFMLTDSDGSTCAGGTGFDDDAGINDDDYGLVFAELVN